jgi:DNA-binding transcriptional regulator YiaG
MDQTSNYSSAPHLWANHAVMWIPVTLMFGVGTGGAITPEHIERARDRDTGLTQQRNHNSADNGPTAAEVISAANDITFIRSVIKASTADLAKCIGVSRQALYNWRVGSNIKDKNADRVGQLKSAATVLASHGITGNSVAMRHPLPGGRTLLETIAGGGNGEMAAQTLVTILRDESEQQRMLERQFANRRLPRPSVESHTFREDG